MLNLQYGKPVAAVRHNKKLDIIRLLDDPSAIKVSDEDGDKCLTDVLKGILHDKRIQADPYDIIDEDSLIAEFGGLKALRRGMKNYALNRSINNKLKKISEDATGKEINLYEGSVELVPAPERECILLTGPSGSGKSYVCARYMEKFQTMFPDRELFVISRLTEDPTLDDSDATFSRIVLDNEFVDDTPVLEDFPRGSLLLFDDVSSLEASDKKLFEAVMKLQSECLETGRHNNLYMLVTNHLALNYKHTRMILAESSRVVFYPHGGSVYQIKQYLKRYAGMDSKAINKFLNLPSRWACYATTYPAYVAHEKGIYLC